MTEDHDLLNLRAADRGCDYVVVRIAVFEPGEPLYWAGDPEKDWDLPVSCWVERADATPMTRAQADRVALVLLDRSAGVREALNYLVEPAP